MQINLTDLDPEAYRARQIAAVPMSSATYSGMNRSQLMATEVGDLLGVPLSDIEVTGGACVTCRLLWNDGLSQADLITLMAAQLRLHEHTYHFSSLRSCLDEIGHDRIEVGFEVERAAARR